MSPGNKLPASFVSLCFCAWKRPPPLLLSLLLEHLDIMIICLCFLPLFSFHLPHRTGKATHGNPGVVLNEVLNQLESYSNMIEPVVVCMSQMTELTFDVISYEIVSRLSNPTRNKIKDDGQNIANWMDSMATFCGMLWKRYPTTELQVSRCCSVVPLRSTRVEFQQRRHRDQLIQK